MLTRLEPIGRIKYRLRGPRRVATYLMGWFIFVPLLIFANFSMITSFKWKDRRPSDGYLRRVSRQSVAWSPYNKPVNARWRRNAVIFPKWPLAEIMALLWFERKVRWNSVGLFRWAMCMTFLSAALRIRIKIWCPYVFGRGGVALYFTQLVRWKGHFKNKHFLVCHSHTRPHTLLLHTELRLTELQLLFIFWIKPRALKKFSGQSIYLFTDIYWGFFWLFVCFFSIARNMSLSAFVFFKKNFLSYRLRKKRRVGRLLERQRRERRISIF